MIYPTGFLQYVLKHRYSPFLACLLSVAIAVVSTLLVPSFARAGSSSLPPPKVLVFPFTNNAGDTNQYVTEVDNGNEIREPLASVITGVVRLKINGLGYYRSTGYTVLNPSIQRALYVDNTIGVSDLPVPGNTPNYGKIAQLVGTPYYLVGNIDSVTTDTTGGTVTVAMDGTFYDTETGASIKQANVSGVAAPASTTYDPQAIQSDAIDNAAGKLVAAVVGPQLGRPTNANAVHSSKGDGTKFGAGLLFLLTVALALVLIHNHSHSSGSNSNSSTSSSTSGSTGGSTGIISSTGTTTTTTGPPAPP